MYSGRGASDVIDSNARDEGGEQRVGAELRVADVLEVCANGLQVDVLADQRRTQLRAANELADLFDARSIGIENCYYKVLNRVAR